MKLVRHVMKVQDLDGLADFYVGSLGMAAFGTAKRPLFGFDPEQCLLEFRDGATKPYQPANNDFYWKIGFTLRDLDVAVAHLREKGVPVTDPYQFRDIGYMSKIRDPNGFIIELLQQGFEGNSKPVGDGHPIAAQATFAHITLRVTDIDSAKTWCDKRLGQRLMSVQPVDDFDFCLYFYGWSDEELPHKDIQSVENREWLWSRPYALIEFQHLTSADAQVRKTDSRCAGFDGFAYETGEAGDRHYVTMTDLGTLL